ncbi:ABC transporter permease [Agromyces sp. Soil535]|uniref:ABC transporter permease n=1 Tax=Agromyces sp. Soil535 TaxID=1736390 RepID=UPI000A797235|nr:ABC transporter permease subunit [Agromyces sp. Soil535]
MAVTTMTQLNAVVELRREVRAESMRSVLRALGTSVITFLVTIVSVIVLWVGVLWVFDVSPYIAKGPVDVWNYLFTVPDAAANRAEIGGNLVVTLGDALIGFVAGLTVALVGAIVFQLSKGIEHALMPVAMLLRSVPLVAMAPVIIMIFGRDAWSVAVIGGIVVLFPALVSIAFGLKSASPQMHDVVTVYGGTPWTALRKVALPSSSPSFFAAVRISVPGAITGALLAEWLATGEGIGGAVGGYIAQAQFSALWTSVVVVTAVSLVLYNVVQIAENVVLARMGMHPDKRA